MSSIVCPHKASLSVPERAAAITWLALAANAEALSRGWWTLDAQGTIPLCPFKLLTGLPCPGCGMMHSLLLAFQGRLAQSAAAHPLGLPLLALWTAWLGWGAINRLRGRAFSENFPLELRGSSAVAALALTIGVYAARLAGWAL